MKKLKLFIAALALLGGGNLANADDVFKDVTNTYLNNANFEGEYSVYKYPRGESNKDRAIYQPKDWEISYTNGKEWDMTVLKSGDLSYSSFSSIPNLVETGGNQTYKIRFNNSYKGQQLDLYQEVLLQSGTYIVEIDYYKGGSGGDAYLLVNSTTTNSGTNGSWIKVNKTFTSDGISKTKIGCRAYHSDFYEKFYAFDNFVLKRNLTASLKSLLEEANTFINGENDDYTALQSVINSVDDVKDSPEATILEDSYNALEAALDLAKNHRKPWLDARTTANTNYGSADYANVIGEEKAALKTELDKAEPTSAQAYDEATASLMSANDTFTAARAQYDAYVDAKNASTPELAYATEAKKNAVNEAKNAGDATSADDADSKTATIVTALRAYYESHALAEGVTGSENNTSLIADPIITGYNSQTKYFGAWEIFSQTDATNDYKTTECLTDANGSSDYGYANIWKSDNNAGIRQTIELPAGKYMLTVAARAQNTAEATFKVFANGESKDIQRIGASGGVYGNGWNDASVEFNVFNTSNVVIGVQSGNGRNLWWSATRFRLVKLSDVPEMTISETATTAPTACNNANVTLTRTLSSTNWNTFSVPFDMAIPEGWAVKEFDSATDNVINFKDATTIVAGVPYLVKPTSNVENPTFEGVTVENTEGETMGDGDYKFAAQIYNKSLDTTGTIAYLSTDGTIKKLTSGGIKGLRAYFIIPAGGNARIAFIDGDQTGINDTVREATNDNRVYDLQGRQVKAVKKGIYVVNGKKVIK